MKKRSLKDRILDLIEQRQHQLHYPHEREYLATLISAIVQKELIKKK